MADLLALIESAEGGVKFRGYTRKYEDPIKMAQYNFVKGVTKQIEMIETGEGAKTNPSGNVAGNMFEILPSGKVSVTLKNGIKPMKVVAGKEYFVVADKAAAIEALKSAVEYCEAGKLDEHFKNTMRKAPKGKSANVIDSVKTNGTHAAA